MDAAMAAVLSPTLVASTLAILTITAAAQDRDQVGVPVGADLYLTRTFDPAKLIFGGRGHRVRTSGRSATRARGYKLLGVHA
jgi:DNA-binding response OmpR family regulator